MSLNLVKFILFFFLLIIINKDGLAEKETDYSSEYAECNSLFEEGKYQKSLERSLALLKKVNTFNNDTDTLRFDIFYLIGSNSFRLGDYTKATLYCDSALINSEDLDYTRKSKGLQLLGGIYFRKGNITESILVVERVLKLSEDEKDSTGIAVEYNHLTLLYANIGDIQKSLLYVRKGFELNLKLHGRNHLNTSSSYGHLGSTYSRMGMFKKAIFYCEQEIDILILLKGENYPRLIDSYLTLGAQYNGLGERDEAEKLYFYALDLYLKIFPEIETTSLARIYGLLSYNYAQKLELKKAMSYAKKSLAIKQKIYGEIHSRVSDSYKLLGEIQTQLGNLTDALSYFEKSLEIEKTIEGVNTNVAYLYLDIGKIFSKQQNNEIALDYFKKALRIYEEISDQVDVRTERCLFEIAKTYNELEVLDSTLYYFQKINQLDSEGLIVNKNSRVSVYNGMAEIYIEMGLFTKASNELKKVEEITNYGLEDHDDFSGIYNLDLYIYYLELKQEFYKSQRSNDTSYIDLITAIQFYKLSAIEARQAQLSNEASRGIYNKRTYIAYEEAIAHFNGLGSLKEPESFAISERSKKVRLREEFYVATNNLFSDSLLTKNQEVKDKILSYEKKLFEVSDGLEIDTLKKAFEDSLFRLERIQGQLLVEIKEQIPAYYELNYSPFDFSVQRCQEVLTKNESLLEYFIGDSNLYIFVVNKEEYHQSIIPLDFSLEEEVEKLRNSIFEYHEIDQQDDSLLTLNKLQYISAAYSLYQRLIDPVAAYLKEEVIVVADGVINFIPFEALLSAKVNESVSYTEMPYWMNDKLISYQFSGNQMYQLQKKEKHNFKKEVAVFAPSYQKNKKEVLTQYKDLPSLRFNFGPLKYNLKEAESIAEVYDAQLFLDSSATKLQFIKAAQEFNILHLAAHGKSYRDRGGYSFLAFTSDTANKEIENMLFVEDLYNMTLNNDLVVLNACETGLGELKKGTGVVSLSKGLAFAGVRSQLSTLWKIDDQSTSKFIPEFYKNLKEGMRKHEALRTVKRDFIQDEQHAAPFFWAAYTLSGDTSPISENGYLTYLIIFVIGLILIFLFLFLKKRINRA